MQTEGSDGGKMRSLAAERKTDVSKKCIDIHDQ
jgi:hypothetical protein